MNKENRLDIVYFLHILPSDCFGNNSWKRKANKIWVFLGRAGVKRRGEKGNFRGPHVHPFSAALVSSSLSEKTSHSSLWSSSASKGHRRTVLSILLLLLPPPGYRWYLQPDLGLSDGTRSWTSHLLATHLASSELGFTYGLKQRLCFCMYLFYHVRQNPAGFVSRKSSLWRWDFADWISKLVDNYFSISVIPAGRIYSQYTEHNITHAHSSSSACSSSLPLSFFLLVPWGLYLHES